MGAGCRPCVGDVNGSALQAVGGWDFRPPFIHCAWTVPIKTIAQERGRDGVGCTYPVCLRLADDAAAGGEDNSGRCNGGRCIINTFAVVVFDLSDRTLTLMSCHIFDEADWTRRAHGGGIDRE